MRAPALRRETALLTALAVIGALLHGAWPGEAEAAHLISVGGAGTAHSPYVYSGVPAGIPVGDTVSWLNPTATGHTVTPSAGPDPGFRKHDLTGRGSSYQYRFTIPGSYAFHCRIHPDTMRATLVVTPASPAPAPRAAPPTGRAAAISAAATRSPAPERTPAPSPRATPRATARPVALATPETDAETETMTQTTSGDTLPTAPMPPLTGAPMQGGGPSPPLTLGLLVLVAGLSAGALLMRRRG